MPPTAGIPDGGGVEIRLPHRFHDLKHGASVSTRTGGRTQALLSALAPSPRRLGVPRGDLLESIWPQYPVALSVAALHSLVYSLHRSPGDALAGQSPVASRDWCYRLNGEAGVVLDIHLFDDAIDAAERLARAGQSDAAMSSTSVPKPSVTAHSNNAGTMECASGGFRWHR
jgi:DNA-binding SARP family transcriptional activator